MTRRKVKRIREIYLETNLLACDRSITSSGLTRLRVNAARLDRVGGGKGVLSGRVADAISLVGKSLL